MQRQRHTRKQPSDDGGRDRSPVHKPRNAWNQEKLRESKKDPPLETSQGARPYEHLDFALFASRTLREQISVCSHPVCCNLLRQPKESNKATQALPDNIFPCPHFPLNLTCLLRKTQEQEHSHPRILLRDLKRFQVESATYFAPP